MAHITGSKSVAASAVHTITIGGHAAKWVDISLASTWTASCPGDSKPSVSLLAQVDDPANGWGLGLSDKERDRIILVDLGSGQTGLIVIDSGDPTRFDQLGDRCHADHRVIHVQVSTTRGAAATLSVAAATPSQERFARRRHTIRARPGGRTRETRGDRGPA